MSVCLLSSEEVGRLLHYRLNPDHEAHVHIDVKAALDGVVDGTYEVVHAGEKQFITHCKCYFLRRTPSGGRGGIDTIQRVLSNHIMELKPIR